MYEREIEEKRERKKNGKKESDKHLEEFGVIYCLFLFI